MYVYIELAAVLRRRRQEKRRATLPGSCPPERKRGYTHIGIYICLPIYINESKYTDIIHMYIHIYTYIPICMYILRWPLYCGGGGKKRVQRLGGNLAHLNRNRGYTYICIHVNIYI